jgi:hypothetical protein
MNRCVGAVLLLLCSEPTAQAAELRLRASVDCAGPIVRLADVAEVSAADPTSVGALKQVMLCPSPAAGTQRSLGQEEIRQLLVLSGAPTASIAISGSDRVLLRAGGERGGAVSGTGAVRQALFMPDAPGKRQIDQRATPTPQPSLAAGSAAATPLIERGTSVTVVTSRPGIQIRTSGKALHAGSVGETISVELVDGRQRVQGRITGPQMVEVAANGGQPDAAK